MNFQEFKERRLVQWCLAYIAGAWLVLQVVNTLADPWNIPEFVERAIAILLLFGFFVAATVAWFHGEQGRQHVSGAELLILTAILGLSGFVLMYMGERESDALEALEAEQAAAASASVINARTVAVLPFTDLSPGRNYEYFADGVAAEIVSALTQSGSVRVASRTSSFAMRGRPVAEVGAALSVATVLEGSVRVDGNRLRISVELVDAANGFQVWAQQFDRESEGILQIQAEISSAVVRELSGENTNTETSLIDPEAYDSYLQARYYWNRRDPDDLERAVTLFQRAIELAPDFARAYAGLADTYAVIGYWQYQSPDATFPEAERMAREALALEPGMAEALATLAYVDLYYDWDWDTAESLFREAIAANSQYPVAHQWYANLLVVLGRTQEAEEQIKTAMGLDPLSLIARIVQPWVLYYGRDYDKALELIDHTIALDPNFTFGPYIKGWILQQTGDLDDAIAALQTAVELSGGSGITLAALAHAYALAGENESAREILGQLTDPEITANPPAYEIAKVYLALGDEDELFAWLDRAYERRSNQVIFARVDPQLDSVRGDERFQTLTEKLGL
jgi:TolB-like protein/Tfp pilus assembly protein PilF